VSDLHWSAIWRAGVSVAVLLLPIAIIMEITRPHGAALLLGFVVILFLAAVAGFGAAKLSPEHPLPNGAAAAALGYVIVQGIGVVHHIVSGGGVSPISYAYLALLMATCGMLGAMLERRTRAAR
jgi:hypothetical protein